MPTSRQAWPAIIAIIIVALGLWWFGTTTRIVDISKLILDKDSTTAQEIASVRSESKANSILAAISSLEDVSKFSQLLVSTGVSTQIEGRGPYTLFMPRNSAFNALTEKTIAGMRGMQKTRLAKYHIISGKAIDPDAVKTGTVQTLSKDPLNFSVNPDGSVSVGTAHIISAYRAKNGVVFVINTVLLPPKKNPAF